MEAINVINLSFAYPEEEDFALKNITFSVKKGEFLTICGASGSGKTTLLRLLKPALSPHGRRSGEIYFCGKNIGDVSQREQSSKIGFVQQSPENQIVTDKVWHELAFGLESLGCDNNTIRRRVAETASFFGLEKIFEKNVGELSGGQKQLLNLASIMAMQPELLIFDEPTSQLDPIAASDFLACIHKINRELGITVIITEHRLDEILPVSDKVLVIEDGSIISFDTPQKTGENLKNSSVFMSMPAPMRIWSEVCVDNTECPVTVAQGREWLSSYAKEHELFELYPEEIPDFGECSIRLKNIWFRYEKKSPDIIKGLSFEAHRGEFIAVLGGNGAGKTTMLSLINGINKPYSGSVEIYDSKCSALPQNPKIILSGNSVIQSLEEMLEGKKIPKEEKERRISAVVSLCKLKDLLQRHPFDLSGGEQQRAALAKILLLQPRILLLDEPTKGLDAEFKAVFAQIISTLAKAGATVVMVSHDVEFCAKYAHRCVMLFNGEIITSGTPREFFASNSFYVTSARRMSKGIIENSVTSEDVIYCCTGKKTYHTPDIGTDLYPYNENNIPVENNKNPKIPIWRKILSIFGAVLLIFGICVNTEIFGDFQIPFFINFFSLVVLPLVILMFSLSSVSKKPIEYSKKSKLAKRTVVAAIMIFLTIPVTIFIGTTYLYDQKYLFISLLVLIECMLPFFLIFEGRKPQARELVIIAVMCAITIASRSIFIPLPQVKPVIALVIISGVAFGGESGFMVGAITMLVSNIYFGQGAWTPWQMFAAGIIGYISGILFQKGFLRRSRGALCVYGFIVTILIYGLIMNFSTIILSRVPITAGSLLAYYAQGLPMDIVHAFSTLVFLFFAAEPMLEKLDRVKTKYGLIN